MPVAEPVAIRRQKGQIWRDVRSKWLLETPEEAVGQGYLCLLVNDYGFAVEQIESPADPEAFISDRKRSRIGSSRSSAAQFPRSKTWKALPDAGVFGTREEPLCL